MRHWTESGEEDWWFLALLEFGVGDVLFTIGGLERGVSEGNPIALAVLEQSGYNGLVIYKIGLFVLFYLIYRSAPDDWQVGVPIGIFLVGSIVVIWNLIVLEAHPMLIWIAKTLSGVVLGLL